MNFNNTVLAIEMEDLHRRENEMYKFYDQLFRNLRDPEMKKSIRMIREQELGHVKMAQEIIALLRGYIVKG